ncbi:hypothetical protein GCM10010347_59240 [Streptomyces cirratus]|uniref:PASTA domain-containing protein n=1 Tax=Streptomyces cirratus TaxID=68187 RepID=A0ABQ3F372_9ACTN|nr:PASTA domain-containing protein [Streptomyces cirratus]GHB80709.1 hypothetical protein GCM10010347_59240 [Streptomyces cirratus]
MRTHHAITLLTAAAALTLTACQGDLPSIAPTSAAPTATTPAASAPAAAPPAKGKTATLPNLVGKGLQTAQDEAQASGFYALKSHDSLGRDRMQVLDRDWKVCSQSPAGGVAMETGTTIDLGAVKLEETCPVGDVAAPKPAGSTMPNFVGQGMKAVRGALPSNASITVKDALQGRMVLQESNWKVCTQAPSAGTALSGQPVSFTVAKTEETCP